MLINKVDVYICADIYIIKIWEDFPKYDESWKDKIQKVICW